MLLGSRNESTKGQGATLLKTTLHTTSRCVNRAEGPLCPGRRNFEIRHLEWSILHDLFFYHRGSISKIPSAVFWFSEAANCIRNPPLKRRKGLFFMNPLGMGGRVQLELRSLSCESWAHSTTLHSWACPHSMEKGSQWPCQNEAFGSLCLSWQQDVWAHIKTTCWGPSL